MTNPLYPLRRTLFFAAALVSISAMTMTGIVVRRASHGTERFADFTVYPGERLSSLWGRLESHGLASEAALRRIAASVPFPRYPFVPPPSDEPSRFEGLFVPGEYRVALPAASGDPKATRLYRDDLAIVNHLLERFAARLSLFGSDGRSPGYKDIILASIVQKEDVPRNSSRLIASVFLNRLRAGMHLSSCPTLEYALGYHRPFLLDSDIAVESPYNTYRNPGLPPTPICFFTDRALESVVDPVSSPYYFFVLDWVKREIHFAKSYADQERNAVAAKTDFVSVHGRAALHRKQVGVFY